MTPGGFAVARILLVGYEHGWLEDRRGGLRAAGHMVSCAHNLDQGLRSLQFGKFDVLVLGNAIPLAQRNNLAGAAKRANPETRVLILYSASVDHAELADALVDNTATTEDLHRAVEYLMGTRIRSG